MRTDSATYRRKKDPRASELKALKEFHSYGRGSWEAIPENDWNDWKWQLKNRITSVEQLERILPGLTNAERLGAQLAGQSKLALAITPYFFNLVEPDERIRSDSTPGYPKN
jgi:lysine 2,3-aminomutase